MKKVLSMIIVVVLALPVTGVFAQTTIEKIGVQNELIVFEQSDFVSNFEEGGALEKIRVSSLPPVSEGVLELTGEPLSEDAEVSLEDIIRMTFRPATDWQGSTSFYWQGAADGGYVDENNVVRILIGDQSAEPEEPSEEPGEPSPEPEEPSPEPEEPEPEPEEPSPEPEEPAQPQLYQDMAVHWAAYSTRMLFDRGTWQSESLGPNRYFYPERTVSRIEFVMLVLASKHVEYDDYDISTTIFEDEESMPMWVRRPAHAAYDLGVIKGEQDGDNMKLNPYETLTRVEAIQILSNSFDTPPAVFSIPSFADIDSIPTWGYDAILKLSGYGLVNGYEDNTFRPFRSISRAEAAELVWQLVKGEDMLQSVQIEMQ